MESPVAFLSIRQLLQSDTTRLHGRTTLCVADIESQAARGTLVCVSRSEPWHSVHKAQGEKWGRGLGDWHERETECWGGGGGGGGVYVPNQWHLSVPPPQLTGHDRLSHTCRFSGQNSLSKQSWTETKIWNRMTASVLQTQKRISSKICILCVRIKINKRSLKPFVFGSWTDRLWYSLDLGGKHLSCSETRPTLTPRLYWWCSFLRYSIGPK